MQARKVKEYNDCLVSYNCKILFFMFVLLFLFFLLTKWVMNHSSTELFLHTDTSKWSWIHYNWPFNKQMNEAVTKGVLTYPFTKFCFLLNSHTSSLQPYLTNLWEETSPRNLIALREIPNPSNPWLTQSLLIVWVGWGFTVGEWWHKILLKTCYTE